MSDNMYKFTDFSRGEIYAFHRTTMMLSTFILAASFAILALDVESDNECVRCFNFIFFLGILGAGFSNIFLAWIWIKKSIYKYYARLDRFLLLDDKKQKLCNKLRGNAKPWELTIWGTFLGCFFLFILFLLTSGVLSKFQNIIGN